MIDSLIFSMKRRKKCYLLILPTFIVVLLFRYYPAFSGMYYSFFEWDGALVKEWVGLKNYTESLQDVKLLHSFMVVGIFILANLFKLIPSVIVALLIFHLKSERFQYVYRVLFVVPMIIPGIVYMLLWKFFYEPNIGLLNQMLMGLGIVDVSKPLMWLADPKLVIPCIIFMGFPWVGVVSVLIFLAGLQGIPKSVYEAAELDGCGPIKRCLTIEVPLIMAQIRLSLVLMIIGTLKGFEQILIMCNEYGGPDGTANVPGLYMFRMAFMEGRVGYACTLGMLLFIVILALTILSDKFVRVDK
ncbi:MAG: sugar ABC transporter permease [Phycisphaeraceae bacterium]|nr:sugar ABC transporter permease [Phycisphaeraceae bacterium]